MNTISDDDLILYFYRDGLDAGRIGEIDEALFASPDLRARYTRLQQMLHAVDAEPAPEPGAQFSERVWQRLDARIASMGPSTSWRARLLDALHSLLVPRAVFAAACMLLFAIGIGFYAGRSTAPQPDEIAQTRANAMATRRTSIEKKSGASAHAACPMVKATSREMSSVFRDMRDVAMVSSGPPTAMPMA